MVGEPLRRCTCLGTTGAEIVGALPNSKRCKTMEVQLLLDPLRCLRGISFTVERPRFERLELLALALLLSLESLLKLLLISGLLAFREDGKASL